MNVKDKNLQAALQLYDQIMGRNLTPEDLDEHDDLHRLSDKLLQTKADLSLSRTSRLNIIF